MEPEKVVAVWHDPDALEVGREWVVSDEIHEPNGFVSSSAPVKAFDDRDAAVVFARQRAKKRGVGVVLQG